MALISVTEYANKYGKDPGNVRRMLACGRLSGNKIGKQWVIDENTPYPTDKRIVSGEYRNWRNKKLFSLDELKSIIIPILEKYNAEGAILFGSYARGEATLDSDIDLLVVGGKDFEPTDIFSIADELFDATKKHVDVYESAEIDKKSDLYSSIEKEGVKVA